MIGASLLREPARPERIRRRPDAHWLVVATVCVGAFMGQLDASIVTLAFPTLKAELHTTLAMVEWVGLAYLLALVGTVTAVGRLALALMLGGVVVRTAVMRDRSPLASRPLLIQTLDHPRILLGAEPRNRFDPPPAGQRAGIPAAAVFQTWLRLTRHSLYDRAIASSKPIPVTLTWWSRPGRAPVGSAGRLVWLFQLTSVPCFEAGFVPPGQPIPPPDRDGCDEYQMFDARSGAAVGESFVTRAGAAVLRPT